MREIVTIEVETRYMCCGHTDTNEIRIDSGYEFNLSGPKRCPNCWETPGPYEKLDMMTITNVETK